jgi:hypothetical protein
MGYSTRKRGGRQNMKKNVAGFLILLLVMTAAVSGCSRGNTLDDMWAAYPSPWVR